MTRVIIDTNVPIHANRAINIAAIADDELECVLSCITILKLISEGNRNLVLDAGDMIFKEYQKHLCFSGQPGLGDKFFKWLHDNRYSFPEDSQVVITSVEGGYAEFPEDIGLGGFDPSDKKFVAVANAHPFKPPICVASDNKWWTFKDQLKSNGIIVEFLCPAHVQKVSERKAK